MLKMKEAAMYPPLDQKIRIHWCVCFVVRYRTYYLSSFMQLIQFFSNLFRIFWLNSELL